LRLYEVFDKNKIPSIIYSRWRFDKNLKINSIRISNILSFEYHENIDDCDEYKFDNTMNIMIGPNGAGKSNFIDIINHLFKRILIFSYNLDEDNIKRNTLESYGNDLRNTVTVKSRPHELKKNYQSPFEKKEIKVVIKLGKDDINNLKFIYDNFGKIQTLFKYSYDRPEFPQVSELNPSQLDTIDHIALHLIKEKSDKFLVIKDQLSKEELFVLSYINYFQFLNYLIYLGIHYHDEKWSLLSNTFALVGEIRNYSAMDSKHELKIDKVRQQNDILLNINNENTRRSDAEPAIFTFVKHRISCMFNRYIYEHTNRISSIHPQARLAENSYFKSIRDEIKSILNLTLEIEVSEIPSEFNFYFTDKIKNKISILDLSAGEKSILLFVFIIHGYDLRDGLMIIDEPELHIHPQIQKKFLRALTNSIGLFDLQVFMVTHSPIFVDYETIRKVFRFYRDSSGFTRIIKAEIDQNDASLVRYLTYTNSSKIFFSNKIILVEGPTDEFFYRVFLNKIISSTNKQEDIEILNIQGKNDFEGWRNFLDKYQIQNYYIGDLDNIFNTSLNIISSTDKKRFEDDFIGANTEFADKVQNNSNYKDNKEFQSALLNYIKTNVAADLAIIMNTIASKYTEKIFILKEGELEDYLGISPKGLKSVIIFCETSFLNWYETNPSKEEIESIFSKILS
jgi:putative ATP-dependent endonuclease of OLD family